MNFRIIYITIWKKKLIVWIQQNNDEMKFNNRYILKYKKYILKILFDMFVIDVKDYVLDIKFIIHLNHILNNSLIV